MTVGVKEMQAHLERRASAQRAAAETRASRLRARFPRAAQLLRKRGASRVIVFGSLATGRPSPRSDVDLAVEGLPNEEHMPALAELMELFGCPVDLVRLEQAPEALRARIAEEGRTL